MIITVRDRFETINAMKNRLPVEKKQMKFQYILAWLSLENHENCH